MRDLSRRDVLALAASATVAGAASMTTSLLAADPPAAKGPAFKISLAEWSLHKTIFGGKLNHLDFAKTAKEDYGIEAVEYVNQFFKDKAKNADYLSDMNRRAADLGVKQLLIMIDGEGALGDPDNTKRTQAVDNHRKWLDAAKTLGCHSIRVNAQSNNNFNEAQKLATDGLRALSELAKPLGLNVIVENHGGLSSDGKWLAGVMKLVDMPNCGTLPDFGNFGGYDRYLGVTELMPYAKGVSAKSHDFNEAGDETKTDYFKMLKIVLDAGYHGYVGVEYEGGKIGEPEGIRATKKLLERVLAKVNS